MVVRGSGARCVDMQSESKTMNYSKYNGKIRKQSYKKSSQDYLDYDYLDKLSDDDKRWLDQFSKQYYGNDQTNVTCSSPKCVQGKKNIRHDKECIKFRMNQDNHSRNYDQYNYAHKGGRLDFDDQALSQVENPTLGESFVDENQILEDYRQNGLHSAIKLLYEQATAHIQEYPTKPTIMHVLARVEVLSAQLRQAERTKPYKLPEL